MIGKQIVLACLAASLVRAESPRVPDTSVLDQNGASRRFYTDLVQGKTVAINFIFTTCTTICAPLTATFRSVQEKLGERVGREISLISVTVDPEVDTPQRLKAFADKFRAGPGWTFVTAGAADTEKLLDALNAATPDKTAHTAMVLIGNDRTGHWTRANGLAGGAKVAKLIAEVAGGK